MDHQWIYYNIHLKLVYNFHSYSDDRLNFKIDSYINYIDNG